MKKILIRAGINPLAPPNDARIVSRNLIGGNVGNLIMQTVFTVLSW